MDKPHAIKFKKKLNNNDIKVGQTLYKVDGILTGESLTKMENDVLYKDNIQIFVFGGDDGSKKNDVLQLIL